MNTIAINLLFGLDWTRLFGFCILLDIMLPLSLWPLNPSELIFDGPPYNIKIDHDVIMNDTCQSCSSNNSQGSPHHQVVDWLLSSTVFG